MRDRQPRAPDMYAGSNAPLACALVWCGWDVEAVEKDFGEAHDLSVPAVQERMLATADDFDAHFLAVDCRTLSRVRERALPDGSRPTRPLRTRDAVKGRSDLNDSEMAELAEANSHIVFSWRYAGHVAHRGAAVGLENPRSSRFWEFNKDAEEARSAPNWNEYQYDACVHLGARRKAQTVEGNVDEFRIIRGQCHHAHDEDEWKSTWDPEAKRWVFPSKQEAEYTATLAFNKAVALSWWVARVGKARLCVPRAPGVVEA